MDIFTRARLPLFTLALAVVLLAAVSSASSHLDAGGGNTGQPLSVGLAVPDRPAPVTGQGKAAAGPTTTAPGAAAAAAAAMAAAAATTTTVAGTGGTVEAVDEEPAAEPEPEPEPEPARNRAVPVEPTPPEPPPVVVPVGLTRLPNVELEVLTLTNMDRGNNGIPPIYRNGCLDGEASAWAYTMAENTTMAHSGGGGAAVQGCRGANAYWGDNIGYWQPCIAAEMEAWWMASPSHRPHILDANFTAVGIGVWAEPNGRCWFQVYFGS